MESYLHPGHYDLITPDGKITKWLRKEKNSAEALVKIEKISPAFVGFQIDQKSIFFNFKSILAQLGLNGVGTEYNLDEKNLCAEVKVSLQAFKHLGENMLSLLTEGTYIGKIFAADERRRVRTSDYLYRMFNRSDRFGNPLLSLGGLQGSQDLLLETIEGHAVAYLSLREGAIKYDSSIEGALSTFAKALTKPLGVRHLLSLHQYVDNSLPRTLEEGQMLLVRTLPLHVRTVFGKVVDFLLPSGVFHTRANVLQPDTQASGDIYELFGSSDRDITDIPLEFYTLEPHREHVFFSDRDQLQANLERPEILFKTFETAPQPISMKASVFIVKGTQLHDLKAEDWIVRKPQQYNFPGITQDTRQAWMVERYIANQSCYPFLKAIEDGLITSQGILLTRYFPSPLMKRMLLSYYVHQQLKGLYFQYPSLRNDNFFTQEDRALLSDLSKFGVPVYWVDQITGKILQYIQKPGRDTGLFVPLNLVKDFFNATTFGVYGSNLKEGEFEHELYELLQGVLSIRTYSHHPLLKNDTPLALVTGGGPGVMEVGNRVARSLNILSCANIIDFRTKERSVVREQQQNPHIDAKMTYTLDKIVERQAAFQLDFPIFLLGGIGTDFEFALEEVSRKVGSAQITPILLFGNTEYWKEKITHRFQCNLKSGTISGSEWLSNCFYCVQNAKQGLEIYKRFFDGTLPIGLSGPVYPNGFCDWATQCEKVLS